MKLINSPLRYPGGKTELAPYIENVIINNDLEGCHFIEPFAGGASASLYLLQKGVISGVTLIEYDPLIFSFWHCVFNRTDELISLITESKIEIDTWNSLKHLREIDIPISTMILEMGFAGLFFNRTNFSGILKAGPIGGNSQESKYKIDCRFNKERIIRSIQFFSLYRDRVQVMWANSLAYLSEYTPASNEITFFYVDPPYYDKGKSLYRKFFTDDDHAELARKLISLQQPWLLSYDKCPFISHLYNSDERNIVRQTLFFDYSAGGSKKEKELLISNLEIPPIEGVKKKPFAVS